MDYFFYSILDKFIIFIYHKYNHKYSAKGFASLMPKQEDF